jgi:hypothetical protein
MEKVVTKKSFIGGRLVYPGEMVDVDEKGDVICAPSTPIGQMSPDQIEAYLRGLDAKAKAERPKFGDNVADPSDANTGTQRLEIAPFRPGNGPNPQGIPPGTEPHGDLYVRPAADDAPAAIEVVTSPGGPEVLGGPGAPIVDKPLDKQNKDELLQTAKARGVAVDDGSTKADIVAALNKGA